MDANEKLWEAARGLIKGMSEIEKIDAEIEPARVGSVYMPQEQYRDLRDRLAEADASVNDFLEAIRFLVEGNPA